MAYNYKEADNSYFYNFKLNRIFSIIFISFICIVLFFLQADFAFAGSNVTNEDGLNINGNVMLASSTAMENSTYVSVGRMNGGSIDKGGKGIAVNELISNLSTGKGYYAYYSKVFNNKDDAFIVGGHFAAISNAQSTSPSTGVEGVAGVATANKGEVYYDNVRGGFFSSNSRHSSGIASINNALGLWVWNNFADNTKVNNLYGIKVELTRIGSDSRIDNNYGLYINSSPTQGKLGSSYGVYIDELKGDHTYGIYQAHQNNKNYFSGNVGIGTTKPGNKLHIQSSGDTDLIINTTVSTARAGIQLAQAGIGGFKLAMVSNNNFVIRDNAGTDVAIIERNGKENSVYIKRDGNVGIGTRYPSQKLEVNGNARILGSLSSNSLKGVGKAYVCVDSNGILFRSLKQCI